MKTTISFDTRQYQQRLTKMVEDLKREGRAELLEQAEIILNKSQALVPVDTGDLRKSGRIITHSNSVYVAYGDERTDGYALIQHEDMTLNHPRGGQAKFLEQPALEQFNRLAGPLGQRVRATVSKYRII